MRMQPTFRIPIAIPCDEAIQRLRSAMSSPDLSRDADTAGLCLDFRVPRSERHLWSPHLSIQLSALDDSSVEDGSSQATELFGRFSPRPEIWTFIMAVYFAATFVAICGAIYGCAQLMLGSSPWAFIALPIGGITIFALHLMSVVGQQLSANQMVQLRERFDRVMATAFDEA